LQRQAIENHKRCVNQRAATVADNENKPDIDAISPSRSGAFAGDWRQSAAHSLRNTTR
jgi:hypothetical protein